MLKVEEFKDMSSFVCLFYYVQQFGACTSCYASLLGYLPLYSFFSTSPFELDHFSFQVRISHLFIYFIKFEVNHCFMHKLTKDSNVTSL